MNAETPDDQLRVHTDRQALCRTVAEDLIDVLREAVDTRGTASAVLTGGGTGTGILEALAAPELAGQVDWSAVHLWWGDERYLPAGNGERNEVLATDALLSALVEDHGLPPENIHRMPAAAPQTARSVNEVHDAARVYAAALADHAAADPGPDPRLPVLDVVLLGMGPDAHVASLFPGLPGPSATGQTVIGVTDSPKPPPERISLTLESLGTARRVWLVVAGQDKAETVSTVRDACERGQRDANRLPATAVNGTVQTRWDLDRGAAGLEDTGAD